MIYVMAKLQEASQKGEIKDTVITIAVMVVPHVFQLTKRMILFQNS